jgi:hypothetical protein
VTGETGRNADGTERDDQDDDTCGTHALYCLLLPRVLSPHGGYSLPPQGMTKDQRYKGT